MNLFIATPCYGGVVTRNFMLSMITLNNTLVKQGVPFTLATLGNESLITRARNTLVAQFMEDEDATHLLFLDADMRFSPETILRLLRHGGPVVAAACPKKSIDWETALDLAPQCEDAEDLAAATAELAVSVSPKDETFPGEVLDRKIHDGFVRTAYAGTAIMLIARPVIERLIKEFPETRYRDLQAPEHEDGSERHLHALFDTSIHPETGHYLSEDYTFCHRWRKCGGEVWLDAQSSVGHEGTYLFEADTRRRVALEARKGEG